MRGLHWLFVLLIKDINNNFKDTKLSYIGFLQETEPVNVSETKLCSF